MPTVYVNTPYTTPANSELLPLPDEEEEVADLEYDEFEDCFWLSCCLDLLILF